MNYLNFKKLKLFFPAEEAQLVEHHPKGCQFNSQSKHIPGLQV